MYVRSNFGSKCRAQQQSRFLCYCGPVRQLLVLFLACALFSVQYIHAYIHENISVCMCSLLEGGWGGPACTTGTFYTWRACFCFCSHICASHCFT